MLCTITRLGWPLGLAGILVIVLPLLMSSPVRSMRNRSNAGGAALAPPFTIALQQVAAGLQSPVHIANAGDGSGRLFVVEQAGHIRVIDHGTLLGAPFLNIANQVACCVERGLLSVAFDPDYATNGTFYIDYTTNAPGFNGDTIVARYVVADPSANIANVLTVTHILTVAQPEANHNGGQLQFGSKDNYLYISLGDGGGGGDQHGTIGNGQSLDTLLGKLLRVSVRGVPTYTIPASNPFTQTLGARPEIWAYGLRNPWRFSFDRVTGDMYIGDVGQDCWEEIDYQPAASPGGENYGWRLMEGFHYFDPAHPTDCSQPVVPPGTLMTLTRPITNYDHSQGDAVVGGYVYRGQQYPWVQGVYFYSDEGSGRIWTAEQVSPGVWATAQKLNSPYHISSFGEDEQGELYVAAYSAGAIYKITSASPTDFSTTTKQASRLTARPGDRLTYTLVLRSSGSPFPYTVRVTDTIPSGLAYVPGSLSATLGSPDDLAAPQLTWSGILSATPAVTITYTVTVTATNTQTITNSAIVDPGQGAHLVRSAAIVVNGRQLFLPIIFKS